MQGIISWSINSSKSKGNIISLRISELDLQKVQSDGKKASWKKVHEVNNKKTIVGKERAILENNRTFLRKKKTLLKNERQFWKYKDIFGK